MRYFPTSAGRRLLLGVAVAALGAPASRADSITADFNDVTPGQAVTVTLGSTMIRNTVAGTFTWTSAQPSTSFLAPNFQSYCIDLSVNVQLHSNFTLTGLTPHFSATTASRIREFWGEHIAAAGSSASNAAAFQLGLWEIVHESANNLDLNSGDFKVTVAPADTVATAQSWLDNVNGQGTFADGLIALDSADSQDQLVQYLPGSTVPVPPAVILGGMGLMSLIGYGLRRRQTMKAAPVV